MIRLTVMYNLRPDLDEAEFLKWRMTEHQESNMSTPGVIRSTFSRVEEGYPRDVKPPYRFMTTADWPDMETFHAAFYDPEYQEGLKEALKISGGDYVFLISEILLEASNE